MDVSQALRQGARGGKTTYNYFEEDAAAHQMTKKAKDSMILVVGRTVVQLHMQDVWKAVPFLHPVVDGVEQAGAHKILLRQALASIMKITIGTFPMCLHLQ